MVKRKQNETKFEEIDAFPSIGMLEYIEIKGKDHPLRIGGFSTGGFYLEKPYKLKEEETKNIFLNEVTYYTIIKDKKLQSKREKEIRERFEKQEQEKIEWRENRIKEIKEELEKYEKEKLEETNQKGVELK